MGVELSTGTLRSIYRQDWADLLTIPASTPDSLWTWAKNEVWQRSKGAGDNRLGLPCSLGTSYDSYREVGEATCQLTTFRDPSLVLIRRGQLSPCCF